MTVNYRRQKASVSASAPAFFFSVTSITMHNIFTHTHKHTHDHDDIMAGIRIPSIWFSSLDQHSLLARNKRIGQVMKLETKLIQIRLSTRRKKYWKATRYHMATRVKDTIESKDGQLRTEKKNSNHHHPTPRYTHSLNSFDTQGK